MCGVADGQSAALWAPDRVFLGRMPPGLLRLLPRSFECDEGSCRQPCIFSSACKRQAASPRVPLACGSSTRLRTMAATAQAQKNTITLKGSTATVTEFFQYALSSILYQRGVYPPESFEPRKQYGLTVMACKEEKLQGYLAAVLQQFSGGARRGRRVHCRVVPPAVAPLAAAQTPRTAASQPRRPPLPAQSGWGRGCCRRWCWWSRAWPARRCLSGGPLTFRRTRRWSMAGERGGGESGLRDGLGAGHRVQSRVGGALHAAGAWRISALHWGYVVIWAERKTDCC